jgi:hypothetical protein
MKARTKEFLNELTDALLIAVPIGLIVGLITAVIQ